MYDNQLDYRAIQRRADAAVKRQQSRTRLGLFVVNAMLYILTMAFIWGIFLTRDYYSTFTFAAMIVLSAEWTVGVILHAASLWLSSERGSRRMHERVLAREIVREMSRFGLDDHDMYMPIWDEKAKRKSRLTDEDGELAAVSHCDEEESLKNELPRG